MRLLNRLVPALALLCSVLAFPAAAQSDFPNKPIKWIVPYPPGGSTDLIARLMGQHLSTKLGQQILIENRAGGGNNIGTEMAARAPADGYTLFMANTVNAINTTLYKNLNYNFTTDLVPVAIVMRSPVIMQVHPSVPAKTVPEFIAYAKANPGKVNMGSGGVGATGHMAGELFQLLSGIKLTHVPYRGESLALTDLLGGQVQVVFATAGSSIQYIKADKLRPLAVTTTERIALLPDLPTLKEYLPGYEASSWNGLTAPKNTPPKIVEKLNREINAAMADPKIKSRIVDLGGPPIIGSPADFGTIIAEDTAKWAKVIQFSGAKAE